MLAVSNLRPLIFVLAVLCKCLFCCCCIWSYVYCAIWRCRFENDRREYLMIWIVVCVRWTWRFSINKNLSLLKHMHHVLLLVYFLIPRLHNAHSFIFKCIFNAYSFKVFNVGRQFRFFFSGWMIDYRTKWITIEKKLITNNPIVMKLWKFWAQPKKTVICAFISAFFMISLLKRGIPIVFVYEIEKNFLIFFLYASFCLQSLIFTLLNHFY